MKKIQYVFKILPVLLVLSFVLWSPLTISAQTPRLVDGADLLSEREEADLLSALDRISEAYGMDITVVTSLTMEGVDAEAYAAHVFEANGYGDGVKPSGVILFVSMAERDYAVVALGDAYDVFSESDMDSLVDAFLEDLSDGYYYRSFSAYANRCEYIMKYDKRLTPIWIVISLIVGGLVTFFVLKSMISKHKSVKMQRTADSYMRRDTFRLDRSRDVFLYSHVTRRARPKSSSSGGGRSSGGGSRGRSGKF